jgi:ribonuclease PH
MLDLEYEEDSSADVDMNVVMTGSGEFVEIQGTAEKVPFSQDRLTAMIELAGRGIQKLTEIQKLSLGGKI